MGLFYRKPFAVACALFLVSCASGHFFLWKTDFLLAFLLFFAFLLCCIVHFAAAKHFLRMSALAIIIIPIFLGFLCQGAYKRHIEHDIMSYISSEKVEIEYVVLSRLFSYEYETGFEVRCEEIDGNETNMKMILVSPYQSDAQKGFRIRSIAVISDFESDGYFNEKSYYNSKGFYVLGEEEEASYTVLEEDAGVPGSWLGVLNDMAGGLFEKNMSKSASALYRAVFLGDKSGLSPSVKLNFKRTGTYHLLALSGMHLAVISRMLESVMIRIRIGKKRRYMLLPCFIVFYAAFTGFSLSVVRSALMLCVSYLAYLVRAGRDKLTSLFFAGALICLVSPASVSDIGLWLSFFATFGIIISDFYCKYLCVIIRKLKNRRLRRFLRIASADIAASVSATLMTLPFTWASFGKISWIGPAATLILTPLISVMLTLAPIYLLSAATFLSALFAPALEKVADAVLYIAGTLSDKRQIYVSIRYLFVPWLLVPFAVIFFVLLVARLKRKLIIPAAALAFVAVFSVFEYAFVTGKITDITYIHSGNNEYFAVSDRGHHVLVDVSDGSFSKLYSASQKTSEYGYSEIDVLVLTHLHKKHAVSLTKLAAREKVYEVWIPSPLNETERATALSVVDAAEKAGIKAVIYKSGCNLVLLDNSVMTLDRAYISRSTHPVISISVSGNVNILYLSSSYPDYSTDYLSSESVIIGTHGPVCKNEYLIPIGDDTSVVSVADEELVSYARVEDKPDNILLMKNTSLLTLRKAY